MERTISVLITGSSAPLKAALVAAGKDVKDFGKAMVDSIGTAGGNAASQFIAQTRNLSQAVQDAALKDERARLRVSEAQAKLSAMEEKGTATSLQLQSARLRIAEASNSATKASEAHWTAEQNLANAMAQSAVKTNTLTDGLKNLVSAWGATAAKFGTLAIAAVFAAGVKSAGDFEEAMLRIQTNAGASAEEVTKMSKAVLQLAPSVGVGPQKLAESLLLIEGTGFRGSQALDVLTNAAKGARVGGAELDTVVNALTATLSSGISGVTSASQAMGVLNAVVGVGRFEFNEFAKSLSSGILSSAKAFGISLQSVGAAMTVLSNAGEPAEQAATRLRMSLVLMAAPTKQSAKLLTDLGLSEDEAKVAMNATTQALQSHGVSFTRLAEDLKQPNGIYVALQDVKTQLEATGLSATQQAEVIARAFGGGRSGTAILTLYNDLDQLKRNFDQVNQTANQFGSAWEATQKTFNQQIANIVAGAETLAVEMGQKMLPGAKAALQGIQDLAQGIGGFLVEAFDKLRPFLSDIASIWNNLVSIAGSLVSAIAPVAEALGAIAGTAVVGAITAISHALSGLTGFLANNKVLLEAVATVVTVPLVGAFLKLNAAIGASLLWKLDALVRPAIEQIGYMVTEIGALSTAVTFALAAGGIAALFIGAENEAKKSNAAAQELVKTITQKYNTSSFDGAAAAMADLRSQIQQLTPEASRWPGIIDRAVANWTGFGKGAIEAHDKVEALNKAYKDLQDTAATSNRNLILNSAKLQNQLGLTGDQVESLAKSIGVDLHKALSDAEYQKVIDAFTTSTGKLSQAQLDLYKNGKLSTEQIQAIADAADASQKEIENFGKAFEKNFDLVDKLSDATKAHTKALDDATSAEKKYTDAVREGAKSVDDAQQKVNDATDKVAEAQQKVVDAEDKAVARVQDAQDKLTQAHEDAAEKVQNATQKVADAQAKAVTAEKDAADAVAAAQRKLVDAQESAADDIASAQRRVADAQQSAVDAVQEAADRNEEASQRVADAQQNLADAMQSGADKIVSAQQKIIDSADKEREAQERLSDARKQAAEDLVNLRLSTEGSQLSEERAKLRLQDAQDKLAKLEASGTASAHDLADARLDVKEADLSLREATERRTESEQELAQAEADGIDNAKKVKDAEKELADARQQQADAQKALLDAQIQAAKDVASAQRDLIKAQEDATKAQQEGARQIADAQQKVADAQAALNKAQVEGAQKVADAQKALTDAQVEGAQKVATAQKDVADAQKDLVKAQKDAAKEIADAQQALTDAQVQGAKDVADAQKDVLKAMKDVADAQDDLAQVQIDSANKVADAQRELAKAMQAVTDTDTTNFFENQAKAAEKFASDAQAAVARGLDPDIIKNLLTEGPEKAAPILERILSDSSGTQIRQANEAEARIKTATQNAMNLYGGLADNIATTNSGLVSNMNISMDQVDAAIRRGMSGFGDVAPVGGWSKTLLGATSSVAKGAQTDLPKVSAALGDVGDSFDDSKRNAHLWEISTIKSADNMSDNVSDATSDAGRDLQRNLDGSRGGYGFEGAKSDAEDWKQYLITKADETRSEVVRMINRMAGDMSTTMVNLGSVMSSMANLISAYLVNGLDSGINRSEVDMWNWSYFLADRIHQVFNELAAHPYAEGGFHARSFAPGGYLPTSAVFQRPGTLVQWAEPETQGEWFFPEKKKADNLPLAQQMLGGWGYGVVPMRSFADGGTFMDRGVDERGYPRVPSFGGYLDWVWAPSESTGNYLYGAVRNWDSHMLAKASMASGGFNPPGSTPVGGVFVDDRRYGVANTYASSSTMVVVNVDARGSTDPFATRAQVERAAPLIVDAINRHNAVNGR